MNTPAEEVLKQVMKINFEISVKSMSNDVQLLRHISTGFIDYVEYLGCKYFYPCDKSGEELRLDLMEFVKSVISGLVDLNSKLK
jgi:hypothetical protein